MKQFFDQPCITLEEARNTGRGHAWYFELIKQIVVCILLEILIPSFIYQWLFSVLPLDWDEFLIELFITAIPMTFFILYVLAFERRNLRSIGFSKDRIFKSYGIGLLIGFLLFSSALCIGVLTRQYRFVGVDTVSPILLFYFLGYMVQGMHEEVLCRGYMMISMARKNPLWVGVLSNSLLFALIHIANPGFGPAAILNIFLVGVIFSLFMIKFDNIWVNGAMHSVWNYVQGCVFGLSVSGMDDTASLFRFEQLNENPWAGGLFGMESSLIVSLILIITTILLYFLWMKEPKG